MADYSVDTRGTLIKWDLPIIYTFDPSVGGESRAIPGKSDMFRSQGDWVWNDDISEGEALVYDD